MAGRSRSRHLPTPRWETQFGRTQFLRTLSQIRDFLVSIGEAATEAVDGLHG